MFKVQYSARATEFIRVPDRLLEVGAMSGEFSEKPLRNFAAEGSLESKDEEAEPQISHREKNAQRAFRAAVFCLLFPPLLIYCYWMLYQVRRSHGRLSGRYRNFAFATAIA